MCIRDRDKFISVIKDNQNLIYKICYSYCSNSENRKDLQQEILMQLWNSSSKFDGRVKISTWIYRIALNTAISFYRNEDVYKRQTQEILFRIQPDGSNYHVVMRNHYCPKGYYPCAGLIMDKDTLYGITAGGGEFEKGSIFRMSKDGIVFDSLYSINESNGGLSYSELLSAGSWLYGASMYGCLLYTSLVIIFFIGIIVYNLALVL